MNWKSMISQYKPLVHCLTNPISMNDCANIALAFGARPIMAEHPRETAEVTQGAASLVCNLGNISDCRMESILLSGKAAQNKNLFTVLDLVGVGCSSLRLSFAQECLSTFHPSLIKGNASEIKAFLGEESHAVGIDTGDEDRICEANLASYIRMLRDAASQEHCIFMMTGEWDLITDESDTYLIENGCKAMSQLTGTGCMLDVVLASYGGMYRLYSEKEQPERNNLLAALVYGAASFALCGEEALSHAGIGTGHALLFDKAQALTDNTIQERIKVTKYESL